MTWDGMERRQGLEAQLIAHMATTNEKLSNIEKQTAEIDKKVGIQNGRVRELENWKAGINGRIIGISAACSCFVAIIGIVLSVLK